MRYRLPDGVEVITDESVNYNERIRQLEELNKTLAAEVDAQRQREQALGDAYLRLRQLIGRPAFDTPYGPTGEQVWITTETALKRLIAEIDRMRPVVEAACKWSDDYDDGADDGPLLADGT